MRRKRTQYEPQRARAHELLNAGPMTAAEMARVLAGEFEGVGPGERQVRNWIRDGVIFHEPESAPWTIAHAERPEDIPLVLEVMAVFRHPTWWLTVAQGRWVARLRRAVPSLEPIEALDLARKAVTDPLAVTKALMASRPAGSR